MPLSPRVMILRNYLHLHLTDVTVLTRASVRLTTATLQEGKRQTLVAGEGHIPWAYDGMRRITLRMHQILLFLVRVEVSPLTTQGPRRLVSIAKLRRGP
jgi:hypothetical protein